MKNLQIKLFLIFTLLVFTLNKSNAQILQVLKMESTYGSAGKELNDLLRFEQIDYYQIKFSGEHLKSKRFTITVKEIWNGKVKNESVVITSKELEDSGLDKINDTTLNMKVIGKLTAQQKLKITFMFPRFSTTKEYKALNTNEYSLRNLAEESNLPISLDQQFYLMAYILPYERPNGSKSWCEVGSSGADIENWGKKFGVKHYLLFEMKFD